MRKPIVSAVTAIMVLLLSACQSASDSAPGESSMPGSVPLDSPNWVLTWSDEFGGEGDADPAKWEQQAYNRRPNENGPDGWWDADYVALDGQGHLDIRVDEIPNRNPEEDSDATDYATGMVRSKGLFSQTYGRFEARCQLPEQPGWWVAFWLFPDNGTEPSGGSYGTGRDGTEIDIMEGWGWTDEIQHALHYDGYGAQHQSWDSGKIRIPGLDEGFHTFSLVWTPEEYVFYVDGVETRRVDDPDMISQVPAYVKLTGELLTVDWALSEGWANALPEDYGPDHFLVDWVRVYAYQE